MSLEIVQEIWSELRAHLTPADRAFAADAVVAILIDHDYEAQEIREQFTHDSYIKTSLEPYLTESEEDSEEEAVEYYDYDEDDDQEEY